MSLLNTNSPSSTEDLPELTPQKNILISLILLISGLALTSILAFNEIKKNSFSERKAKASKTDSDSISPEQQETAKTSLFERFKKPTTQEDASQNNNVRWPRLKLTAFGRQTGNSQGFAIINGKQVLLGQLIDGRVRLTDIRSQDVLVEYQGETRSLTIAPSN